MSKKVILISGLVTRPDTIPVSKSQFAEICDNNLDDDGDDLVDDFDPDCPCDNSKYNAQCAPDCEVLPDSFPKIVAKVKWVSEHGIYNNPFPLYYNDLLISKNFIYCTSPEFYKDSFINYIILTDPINGRLLERWVIDTIKNRNVNKLGIFKLHQNDFDNVVVSNSDGNFICRNKENVFWINKNINNPDYSTSPYFSDINGDGYIELISGNYIINVLSY